MPEFQMPVDDSPLWESLDSFTRGYIDAMFFTECNSDNPELEDATLSSLSPEALEQVKSDCARFAAANAGPLQQAYDASPDYDAARAGNDLWFTRNGHGVGFWDRGLGDAGQKLSDACGWRTEYHEVDLYRGDDGKLYLS